MKKLSLFSLLLALCFGLIQAQTYNLTVSGQITDISTGAPIANHAVDVSIDSTNFLGFAYYNTVLTDVAGNYSDLIAIPLGMAQGNGYVYTRDCSPAGYQYAAFSFTSGSPVASNLDFSICDSMGTYCQTSMYAVDLGGGDMDFTASAFGSGTAVSYLFDFGDGSPQVTSATGSIIHNYAAPGNYSTFVDVTFSDGCTSMDTAYVTVGGVVACNAAYVWYPDTTGQYSIIVYDQSAGTNLSYVWDFGDGFTSTAANPSHIYNGPGTYTVCLTVTSQNPICTSTYCDSLIVVNKTSAPFSINVISNNATAVAPEVNAALKVSLYPNPAKDYFQIEMDLVQDAEVVVTLMDLTGKVVSERKAGALSQGDHTVKVSTQDLPAGLYMARVQAGDATSNHKVMIAR